jgi:carotenoid cleavage dioxygenase
MHVMNAHTDGDLVIVDYVHRDEVPFLDAPVADNVPRLYRTTIDLERGITNDEMLDTRPVEFPRIDDRRSGLSFRFGYVCAVTHGGNGPKGADFDALVRYDFVSDRAVEHRFPEGIVVGEPVFAPNPDGMSEEDGWVLALTYDTTRDESELVVIDAADFDGEPVARVPMPRRIPAGLHGAWLPAD